jgi:hypothetical protein
LLIFNWGKILSRKNKKTMKRIFINGMYISVFAILMASCGIRGSGDVVRIERNVSSFNCVTVEGLYTVHIKQDSIFKVEVEADDNIEPHIKTSVSGNVLTIHKHGIRKIRKPTKMDVYISAPAYEKIDLKGSGNIYGVNTITESSQQFFIDGSGNMEFSSQSSSTNLSISGSGNIKISGSTDYLKTNIDGSGNIEAYNYLAKTAEARISGSGNAMINVLNSLVGWVSGSGNIIYMGNPTVDKSVTGSGSISKY